MALAQLVVVVFAITGFATTGAISTGTVEAPMQKAIDVHKEHLGTDSKMPDQSTHGQQNSLDRLMFAKERWLSKHPAVKLHDGNDTDDDEGLFEALLGIF